MTVNYNPLTDVLTYTINGQTLTFQPKATNTNWPTGAFMSATMLYLSSNAAGLKVDVSDIKLNGNSVANNSLTIENGEKALVISGYDYYNGFNVTADVVFTYNSLPSAGGALFFDYKFGQTNGCTDGDNGCITEVTVTKTNPPTPVVNITATPGPCVPATNTYSVSGTLSLTNASAGTALITDGTTSTSVAISSGATSVPYSLTGLTSGTGLHTVSVSYASQTASTTYTAPTSCSVAPPCGISLNATPGLCAPATNTYILSGTINTTNVPSAGTLTISSAAFSPRSLTLPAGNASGTFSYSGLVSNGQTYTITASYSNSACAPVSQIYTAPASCSVAPVCSMSATVTAGLCASATNTYSATAVVTVQNPTSGNSLTITLGTQSLVFSTTAASQNTFRATFNGLVADGVAHTVTATLPGCSTVNQTYTAPASCSVATPCSMSATVTAGLCASATNTYSATAVITLINPVAGVITVTNGTASITANVPATTGQVVFPAVFNGLTSDGAARTVTATLAGCGSTSANYTAPASCSSTPTCSLSANVTAGICASATNTYSATAVVRLTNPTAGVLTVTNGAQSLTFATTAVSSATYTAVFNGLTSDGATRTVTATLAGCGSTSANYTAPASCSSTPTCPAPITVCAGSNYAFEVSGPEGMTSYQWYRNGQAISNATSYSYTITQEGSYSLVVNNNGVCPNGSCCPVVIVEEPVPSFTAVGTAPTCTGTTSLTNGQITLTGLGNYTLGQYTYQYVRGTTFVESTSTIPAAAVPLNGIVLTNLSGGDVITIRVYNAATGCYTDQTVTIPVVSCECPPSKCVPFVVKKIRSTK
jgi:hypothetical protein